MQQCLQNKQEQTMRLLNYTGMANIAHSFQGGLEHEIVQNVSKLFNETLITCNKTEFLTVRMPFNLYFQELILKANTGFRKSRNEVSRAPTDTAHTHNEYIWPSLTIE